MSAKSQIFLSYSSFDKEFALRLYADLQSSGIKVWMDKYDIHVGADWMMTLQTELDTCAAFIPIISPDYLGSKFCMNELHRVSTRSPGFPIYPVIIKAVETNRWPLEIQRLQHLDFSGDPDPDSSFFQANLTKFIEILRQQLPAQFGKLPDVFMNFVTRQVADLQSYQGVLDFINLEGDENWHPGQSSGNFRPDPHQKIAPGLEKVIANHLGDGSQKTTTNSFSDLRDVLVTHPQFALIGNPGSGKSTLLRRLAVDSGLAYRENPGTNPLPFYARLADWQDHTTPIDFISQLWQKHKLPLSVDVKDFFKSGKGILFLDGLDEMGFQNANKAIRLSQWLKSELAPAKIVITCRQQNYQGNMAILPTSIHIAPMDVKKIEAFSNAYLKEKSYSFLDQIIPKDFEADGVSHRLFRLAQNPYLLSALMVIYQASLEEDLPRNPGALTQKLVRALWEREARNLQKAQVPYLDLEMGLSKLAFEMLEKGTSQRVPRQFAMELVGSYKLLLTGQNANLLKIEDESISFFNQMFQDFFVAVQLKKRGFVHKLKPPLFTKTYRVPSKWDQAILALSGMVNKPGSVIKDLLEIDPYLAQICAGSGIDLDMAVFDLMTQKLLAAYSLEFDIIKYSKTLIEHIDSSKAKWQITRQTLIDLGPRAVPSLLHALTEEKQNALAKQHIIFSLGEMGDVRAGSALQRILQNPRDEHLDIERTLHQTRSAEKVDATVRGGFKAAALLLGKYRGVRNKVGSEKRTFQTHPDFLKYRWLAAEALGKIQGPSACLLLEKVLNDPDEKVRNIAEKSLKQLRKKAT